MLWWTLKQLRSNNLQKRIGAIKKLGASKDTSAVEHLVNTLAHDPDYEARASAAAALGEIRDVCALEPLVARLKDEYGAVRDAAIEALDKLEDVRAVKELVPLLLDKDVRIKEKVAGVLKRGWVEEALAGHLTEEAERKRFIDQHILAILADEKDYALRMTAVLELTEPSLLLDIANSNQYDDAKCAAWHKLREAGITIPLMYMDTRLSQLSVQELISPCQEVLFSCPRNPDGIIVSDDKSENLVYRAEHVFNDLKPLLTHYRWNISTDDLKAIVNLRDWRYVYFSDNWDEPTYSSPRSVFYSYLRDLAREELNRRKHHEQIMERVRHLK